MNGYIQNYLDPTALVRGVEAGGAIQRGRMNAYALKEAEEDAATQEQARKIAGESTGENGYVNPEAARKKAAETKDAKTMALVEEWVKKLDAPRLEKEKKHAEEFASWGMWANGRHRDAFMRGGASPKAAAEADSQLKNDFTMYYNSLPDDRKKEFSDKDGNPIYPTIQQVQFKVSLAGKVKDGIEIQEQLLKERQEGWKQKKEEQELKIEGKRADAYAEGQKGKGKGGANPPSEKYLASQFRKLGALPENDIAEAEMIMVLSGPKDRNRVRSIRNVIRKWNPDYDQNPNPDVEKLLQDINEMKGPASSGTKPPKDYPDAKWAKDPSTGKYNWYVKRDGKVYIVGE